MIDNDVRELLLILRQQLSGLLGDDLYALLLFGSRARGEAHPESDVDILIVMRGGFDYDDLLVRTSPLIATLSLQYDTVISRAFVSQQQFEQERTPFMLNVRREAVPV
jgi:predicted nucleotidyltransferase